ncbi:MAG: hypothetical protein M0019_01705 [Actinomycetota bacterium]|nr:hypothetical protein [Actinomycetota bacterium]
MSDDFESGYSVPKTRRFSSPKQLRVISVVAPAIVGGAIVASIMNFGVFGGKSQLPEAILISPSGQSEATTTVVATTSTTSTVAPTTSSTAAIAVPSTTAAPLVKTSALEIVPTTSKVYAYENPSSNPSELSSSEADQSQSSVDSIVDNNGQGGSKASTTSTTSAVLATTTSTQQNGQGQDNGDGQKSTTTTSASQVPTTESDNSPILTVTSTTVKSDN